MRVAPIFAIMALTAISSTSVTAADDPIVLPPTSPWHLTYDKESCRLSRRFGEGEQAVDAHFVKYSYGTALEILLEGKPLKPRGRAFTARFSPGDAQGHGKDALFGEGGGGTSWQFTASLIPDAQAIALRQIDADGGWTSLRARAIP